MASCFFFAKLEKFIRDSYPSIFNGKSSGDEGGNNWGYYNIIYTAINGDFTNMEKIKKANFYEVMAFVAYKIEMNEKS